MKTLEIAPSLPFVAAMFGLVFDTETTGLPLWKEPSEDPGQPHIVELAASLVNLETREIIRSIDVIIKPDGWTIPIECTNIHGITNERALEDGIPEKDAVDLLLAMLDEGEALGPVELIGHNESFDRRIVRIAIKRYLDPLVAEGGALPSERWKALKSFCTCWKSKPHTRLPGNKLPKLSEAYQHFLKKPLQGAHSARGDVNGCLEIYFAIKDLEPKPKLKAQTTEPLPLAA